MAAERAAELSEKQVRVAPIHAPQAGLAALLAFDPRKGVAYNLTALTRVAARIRVGGVATAAREDPDSRFRAGEALGYVGDALTAWGPVESVLQATLAELCQRCEIVTAIAGAEAPLDRAEVEALIPDGVELDYHVGDQPAWSWLLWAE
jgi:dihydroxyacetone kinase-like predicted kinase